MDIIKLIEEMEDILDEASTVPFSKKVMVEREELLSVLKEAEKIDQEARNRFETMVNEHDVTIAAQKNAEEITSQAENNARLLKSQSIQYIDEMLETTQDKLHNLLDELQENRNELKG